MKVTSYIRIDMSRPNNETVYVMQYDELSRWVHADLSAFDEAWEIPEGVNVMVRYRKIDGTVGLYSVLDDDSPAYTIDGSSIEIGLAKQAMTVDGKFRVDIVFRLNGAVLSAFPFYLSVKPAAASEDEIAAASEDYITESLVNISAEAHTLGPAADPTVDVEASGMSFSFDFGIPQGPAGPSSAVTSSTQQWQESASGAQAPTGTWSDNPPTSITPGLFLWTKNTITYNNGVSTSFYSVSYNGRNGSGQVNTWAGFQADSSYNITKATIIDFLMPVGFNIVTDDADFDPNTHYGHGTWVRVKDTFILAAGDTYSGGDTGGSANHTLTETELPAHTHALQGGGGGAMSWPEAVNSVEHAASNWGTETNFKVSNMLATESTGGGTAFSIMPPYVVKYVWKRTA